MRKMQVVNLLVTVAAVPVLMGAQKTAVTYESITISTTAVGVGTATKTSPAGNPVTECRGRIEGDAARFRVDGPAPTAAEGELLDVGDRITIEGFGNIDAIRFIRVTTDATLKLTCYE